MTKYYTEARSLWKLKDTVREMDSQLSKINDQIDEALEMIHDSHESDIEFNTLTRNVKLPFINMES